MDYDKRMVDTMNNIKKLREERGLSQERLARLVDTSGPQIHRLENGDRKLSHDWMVRIARALDCEPVDLISEPSQLFHEKNKGNADFVGPIPIPIDEIPVYGTVSGSGTMTAKIDDSFIEGTRARPPMLEGVKNAFYVRVIGDSMEPRYEQGELVAVNADRMPSKNQDCVIITEDGDAHIKRFLSLSGGVVRCLQYNPHQEREYSNVRAIYAVVRAT